MATPSPPARPTAPSSSGRPAAGLLRELGRLGGGALEPVQINPRGRLMATGSVAGTTMTAAPRYGTCPIPPRPRSSPHSRPWKARCGSCPSAPTAGRWSKAAAAGRSCSGTSPSPPTPGSTSSTGDRAASTAGPSGPDGQVWASAEEGRKSTLWDLAEPEHPVQQAVLSGNASSVYAVGFDRSGRLLATGGFDKTVILWDLTDTGQPRQLLALPAASDRLRRLLARPRRPRRGHPRRGDPVGRRPAGRDRRGSGRGGLRDPGERSRSGRLGGYAPDVRWRETCPR